MESFLVKPVLAQPIRLITLTRWTSGMYLFVHFRIINPLIRRGQQEPNNTRKYRYKRDPQ